MFGPVDYRKEVAVTYSPESPKLRMSVLAYMMDARSLPVADQGPGIGYRPLNSDEFMELAERMTTWVTEATEAYVTNVETLDGDANAETVVVVPEKGDDDGAYL